MDFDHNIPKLFIRNTCRGHLLPTNNRRKESFEMQFLKTTTNFVADLQRNEHTGEKHFTNAVVDPLPKNGASNVYICNECGFKASCKALLLKDLKRHGTKCPLCDFRSSSKLQLKYHRVKHSTNSYPCDLCDYVATRKDLLRRHSAHIHTDRMFQCKACNYKSDIEADIQEHILNNCKLTKMED